MFDYINGMVKFRIEKKGGGEFLRIEVKVPMVSLEMS